MERIVSNAVTQPRFNLFLVGLFSVVALLLSAAGIYGVTAYTVAQRTHELGIRLALGAQVGDVLRMILREGNDSDRGWCGAWLSGCVWAVRLDEEFVVWSERNRSR